MLHKVEQNRLILGMSAFCILIVFNTDDFYNCCDKISETNYSALSPIMIAADTIRQICGVLMEEFYNLLDRYGYFYDSGEPVITLLSNLLFLREMSYY